MKNLIHAIGKQGDWPSRILFFAIAASAIWCGLLPVSPYVQRSYLNRFHLQTPSFLSWATQQLTPAMYNLENTYWYSSQPLSKMEREELSHSYFDELVGRREPHETPSDSMDEGKVLMDMVNHFPQRIVTFATSRPFLMSHREGYFYFRSRYRGMELETSIQIQAVSEGESLVNRTGGEW